MARSLKNKPQVQAPTASYPFGRIKDDTGLDDGTPVNEDVYGDLHQFFECLLNEVGITANEQPENEYDGFQFISALKTLVYTRSPLLIKRIAIGPWNMNTTAFINVPHGVSNPSKIRRISVIIHNDSVNTYYDFLAYMPNAGTGIQGGIHGIDGTNVQLQTSSSSTFATDGAFDDGTNNRGYMTVEYEP